MSASKTFVIRLNGAELSALDTLARSELRDPRAQAAHIIRSELERLGLLVREPSGSRTASLQRYGFAGTEVLDGDNAKS